MGFLDQIEAAARRADEEGGIDPVRLPAGLDHLSASSINQFLRCPRQWAYVRVLGIKAPPDGGLVAGKAFHAAAEQTMLRKMETGEDPTSDEAASLAADAAQAEIDAGEVVYDEENYTSSGAIVDKASRFAEAWAQDVAPNVSPAAVESEFDVEMAGVKVVGRIDLEDREMVTRDWKTSGKTPAMRTGTQSWEQAFTPQTMIYAHVKQQAVIYHYVIDQKRGTKTMPVAIVGSDLARAKKLAVPLVRDTAALIAAGRFPRNTGGWHCSKRWCAFYERCMSGKDEGAF